jgi:hemerythrin
LAFIEWKDSYSVGSADLDRQHQQLIAIINRLHDSMRTGAAHALVIRIVDDLVGYTQQHFAYEEKLIAAAGYPGVAEHARKHRAMMAQVEVFADRVKLARATLPLQLMDFLKSWLTQHILSTDMDYSRCLLLEAGQPGR